MPIGSTKLGVLGAGIVPGGTETFNASGTFKVPPGVSKVSITGKGGTGNPGNAGNAGNAGNHGNGGTGGGGGVTGIRYNAACSPPTFVPCGGFPGGFAWNAAIPYYGFRVAPQNIPQLGTWRDTSTNNVYPEIRMGGSSRNFSCFSNGSTNSGNAGQSGLAGQAGQAGQAGNPGNTGNSSSGLCKTFTGGAGGNAGVAGAAGNAGSAGTAGTQGASFNQGSGGGSAGPGGGNGGSGGPTSANVGQYLFAGSGGGGAGVTNDGSSGNNSKVCPTSAYCKGLIARGGTWPSVSAPIGIPYFNACNAAYPAPPYSYPTNTTGGIAGYPRIPCKTGISAISLQFSTMAQNAPNNARKFINSFCPPAFPNEMFRSGAGGGGSGHPQTRNNCTQPNMNFGGGGGGGGRGGAGGAGGNSSAPSGSAATPSTFNCVSVTPGSSYPITVASPGGQIVISWNPQ